MIENNSIFTSTAKKSDSVAKKIIFLLILAVTFIAVYILNQKTHLVSDDFRYTFLYENFWPKESTPRITGFSDIFHSMYNHYFMWGGRVVAHTMLQFILMFDKHIFNIVNSLVFVGLAVVIYLHCNVNKNINLTLLAGICLCLWFFTPNFGLTVLWASGACNYLWCGLIVLLFLLPYKRYIEMYDTDRDGVLKNIAMLLFGLIAGWTNENTGGAMIFLIMMFMVYYKLIGLEIPKWSILGFLSSCVGFVLLAIAPGNSVRSATAVTKTADIARNISKVVEITYDTSFVLLFLFFIILIFFIWTNNNKNLVREQIKLSIMYLLAAFAGMVVLVVSPQVSVRTWFGPVMLVIIAIGNLYSNINVDNANKNLIYPLLTALLVFTSVKFMLEYRLVYYDVSRTYNEVNYQIKTIKEEKEKGNLDITVKSISTPKTDYNAFLGTRYISDNPKSWFNTWMAKYYEINSIAEVKQLEE